MMNVFKWHSKLQSLWTSDINYMYALDSGRFPLRFQNHQYQPKKKKKKNNHANEKRKNLKYNTSITFLAVAKSYHWVFNIKERLTFFFRFRVSFSSRVYYINLINILNGLIYSQACIQATLSHQCSNLVIMISREALNFIWK